jgi:hypothetical protein
LPAHQLRLELPLKKGSSFTGSPVSFQNSFRPRLAATARRWWPPITVWSACHIWLVIVASLLSLNEAKADQVTLTFNATYNDEVVFTGATATENSIAPISFSFSVSFNPAVVGTSGPTFDTSGSIAQTYFGPFTFSPSPFTSALSQLAGVNASSSQSTALETQTYNIGPNTGYRAVGFSSGSGSNYFFSASSYLGGAPMGPSDVGVIDAPTFISDLMTAETQSSSWFIDEGGIFYPPSGDINQRRGNEYRGFATLVSISPVPWPHSIWAEMIFGFLGLAWMAYRRKKSAPRFA